METSAEKDSCAPALLRFLSRILLGLVFAARLPQHPS